jgi:hypothetical protein
MAWVALIREQLLDRRQFTAIIPLEKQIAGAEARRP